MPDMFLKWIVPLLQTSHIAVLFEIEPSLYAEAAGTTNPAAGRMPAGRPSRTQVFVVPWVNDQRSSAMGPTRRAATYSSPSEP